MTRHKESIKFFFDFTWAHSLQIALNLKRYFESWTFEELNLLRLEGFLLSSKCIFFVVIMWWTFEDKECNMSIKPHASLLLFHMMMVFYKAVEHLEDPSLLNSHSHPWLCTRFSSCL